MEKVVITLAPENRKRIRLAEFPELSSENRLVNKGIALLRHYTPDILRYLSKQRLLGHLPLYRIEVRGAAGMSLTDVQALLAYWMKRKRTRRLFYVILELLLMPFTALVALLPGPNIVFYGLFVVFYFHAKALLSLSRIKVEVLNITIIPDA
jgi:hypothetical protein